MSACSDGILGTIFGFDIIQTPDDDLSRFDEQYAKQAELNELYHNSHDQPDDDYDYWDYDLWDWSEPYEYE
ncbi:hypothetical protein [Opitutus sp. ER46]|uniref:hypothetical protein n=1 Tax=Opitutus sp. ER46 TaxID=2161864 RepID=UPI000D305440|nr:hypothetical protein [Opitutus sp. ER46]PTX94187.1 hypothetical protein DB354_10490 [Opitutus sp. ER46]